MDEVLRGGEFEGEALGLVEDWVGGWWFRAGVGVGGEEVAGFEADGVAGEVYPDEVSSFLLGVGCMAVTGDGYPGVRALCFCAGFPADVEDGGRGSGPVEEDVLRSGQTEIPDQGPQFRGEAREAIHIVEDIGQSLSK